MEYLRTIGQQALELFGRILGHPDVTGLLVETDPLLRQLWRIRMTMTNADWDSLDSQLADSISLGWLGRWGIMPIVTQNVLAGLLDGVPVQQQPLPCDPNWTCRTFEAIRQAPGRIQGREGPAVVFTVLYDPSISLGSFEELAAVASGVPRRVRLVSRPVARAHTGPRDRHNPLVGGISMGGTGQQARGTLGGIRVFEGSSYAITCGHVIDESLQAVQPSDPDGGSTVIGTCLYSTNGHLTGPGEACRGDGAANEVDAALVKLDMPVAEPASVRKVGPIVRMVTIKDIVEGEIVRLSARSGVRSLEVGALALRRSISIRGTTYCFQNLMELRRPGPHWGQKGSVKPPTKEGDSGAWVLRSETDGYGWIGMLTAGDGPSSYAQFAETVDTWATTKMREAKKRAEADEEERARRVAAENLARSLERLNAIARKKPKPKPRPGPSTPEA